MKENKQKILAKVILGLPLTAKERAYYLLYIATSEQAKKFIKKEQQLCRQ